MSLSNTVENEMLTDFLTRHPNLYLALSTTNPGEDGSGITEPVGGSYARASVGDVTLSGGQLICDNDIMFATSTADWGTIIYVGVFDAVSGGVFLGSSSTTPTAAWPGTLFYIFADTAIMQLD